MSTRLQVLLPEAELREIRRFARGQGLTVGEWVRRTLREARAGRSLKDPEIKLAALRRAAAMAHPTGDIEQILEETGRGRYE